MTADQFQTLQNNQQVIQDQLTLLYWVMIANGALLFALLFVKYILNMRIVEVGLVLVRAVSEIRAAKSQAQLTEHKIDNNAQKIEESVKKVPEEVVNRLHESPSAGDGDMVRPRFPPPQ